MKKLFENISPREYANEHQESDAENINLGRRNFIRGTVALGALGLIAGNPITKQLLKHAADTKNDEPAPQLELSDATEKLREQLHESANQQEIRTKNHDVIGKTFRQQIETQDHITLDASTRKAIYRSFLDQYKPGGENYQTGLIAGLQRMQPYFADIYAAFKKYDNMPEELMYLAIAESHFKFDDVSNAGAVGPYQITENTAKLYGLIVNNNYDERRDPVKSAELCARHLQDNRKKFGDDWSINLMDYNGGHTKRYEKNIIESEKVAQTKERFTHDLNPGETLTELAIAYNTSVTLLKNINQLKDSEVRTLHPPRKIKIPQARQAITMDDFNAWLQEQINATIQKTLYDLKHKVKPGETLNEIAQKYHTDPNILALKNNISNPKSIVSGTELTIPTPKEKRTEILLNVLESYKENFNYPERFYAIRDVIVSENLQEKMMRADTKKYHQITIPKTSMKELSYTVPRGGSINGALKYFQNELTKVSSNISPATLKGMLCNTNKITDIHKISAGKTLTLNAPINTPPSLREFASARNIPIDILRNLNPAVLNVNASLPEKITLRIPA
ncbi:MAG: transglycosylase SLT domain-containing protein [Parcubacteria group bacterium]|jgi:membrane-bound lytic murein transglycosylase D